MADQNCNPSALEEVPPEIFMVIMDQLEIDAQGKQRSLQELSYELKSLRLCSKGFAYLPLLLSKLFKSVNFMADPIAMEQLEQALEYLQPYVKCVSFRAPKHTWAMKHRFFDYIIRNAPALEFCDSYDQDLRKSAEDTKHGDPILDAMNGTVGARAFVEKYMDSQRPFTEEETLEGYIYYMAKAYQTQESFKNGKMKDAWISALKKLPNLTIFSIKSWESEGQGAALKEQGSQATTSLNFLASHYRLSDAQLQMPVGKVFFQSVIESLTAAGCVIHKLHIGHIANNITWPLDGGFQGLELSKLHTIDLQPKFLGWESYPSEENYDVPEQQVLYNSALNALFERCHLSLTKLRFNVDSSRLSFPPPNGPNMPLLQSLHIDTDSDIHLSNLAAFVSNAPKLEMFELCIGNEAEDDWRDLWKAIRYHPNRMHIKFDNAYVYDWTHIKMEHHTGKAIKAIKPSSEWDDVSYSLGMYLSKRGKWNRNCRAWFETDYYSDNESIGLESGEDGEGGVVSDAGDSDEEGGIHSDSSSG